jgi:hypothetical protein
MIPRAKLMFETFLEFLETVSPWIRIPVAVGLILSACAVLLWAPGWTGRLWGVPLAIGFVLLFFGGSDG